MDYILSSKTAEIAAVGFAKKIEEELSKLETAKRNAKAIRAGIYEDVATWITQVVGKMRATQVQHGVVLCPKALTPVRKTDAGYEFDGYLGVKCPLVIAQRPMKAEEYREVFMSGSQGSKVLHGFQRKNQGGEFSARLKFQPRKKRFSFA